MWLWALGFAVAWTAGVALFASSLLLTPPYYAHRKPHQGLSLKGKPIDPIWEPHIHDPKTDFGIDYHEVSFSAASAAPGIPSPVLRGWHIPSGRSSSSGPLKGIVCVHGGGRDRREFHRFVPFLHEAGYELLLFDCREHGVSDGNGRGFDWGRLMVYDVIGAIRFTTDTLGWGRLGLLGVSNGAVLSILAAAHEDGLIHGSSRSEKPVIHALAVESPYCQVRRGMHDILISFILDLPPLLATLSFVLVLVPVIVFVGRLRLDWLQPFRGKRALPELNVLDVIGRLTNRPILFVHGSRDNRFPIAHSEELYRAYPYAESKTLWLVPFGKHTECYDADPAGYQKRLLAFFGAAL